jgi:hypothetical protein
MANSSRPPAGAAMALLFLLAGQANAGAIYGCPGPNGAQVLQDTPCESNSELVVPKDAGDAKNAPAAAPANDAGGIDRPQVQNASPDGSAPASEPVAAGSNDAANAPTEPALGMTQQQVRAILGEPTAITQEEVVQGKETTWSYGDSRVLQFDASGVLTKK